MIPVDLPNIQWTCCLPCHQRPCGNLNFVLRNLSDGSMWPFSTRRNWIIWKSNYDASFAILCVPSSVPFS